MTWTWNGIRTNDNLMTKNKTCHWEHHRSIIPWDWSFWHNLFNWLLNSICGIEEFIFFIATLHCDARNFTTLNFTALFALLWLLLTSWCFSPEFRQAGCLVSRLGIIKQQLLGLLEHDSEEGKTESWKSKCLTISAFCRPRLWLAAF